MHILSRTKLFFKREFLTLYPNSWSLLSHAISGGVAILLYWFTAQALSPKVEFEGLMGRDYFMFVVIGELALMIPATLLYNFTKIVKEMYQSGALFDFVVQPFNQVRFIIEAGFVGVLVRVMNIFVTLIVLNIFFATEIPFDFILKSGFFVLLSIPAFIGLGLVSAAIMIFFGRGERFVIMLSNASYVLAGVYFPVEVFPELLTKIVNIISPFNVLLNSVRGLMGGVVEANLLLRSAISLSLSSLVFFLIGFFLLKAAFYFFRFRQKPILM